MKSGRDLMKKQMPSFVKKAIVKIEGEPKSLRSRKNEARGLLKKCFGYNIFSFVPFEIWRDIVGFADIKSIVSISKSCWGFKELVDDFGENNFNLAWSFRLQGQMILALKFIERCAANGDARAMLHMGFAHFYCGWGLKENKKKSAFWLEKSAEHGNIAAMAYYSRYLSSCKPELSDTFVEKILSSNDSFANALHLSGIHFVSNPAKAFELFNVAANLGDEFGQYELAECFRQGVGTGFNQKLALHWYTKSAEQGLCISQYRAGLAYRDGIGCQKNKDKAMFWFKKAAMQGHETSKCLLDPKQKDYKFFY